MICGEKRVGKSSLVNLLLGEEVCYADSGSTITIGIREYKHKKYNLCIFDTAGFEKIDENENKNLKKKKK